MTARRPKNRASARGLLGAGRGGVVCACRRVRETDLSSASSVASGLWRARGIRYKVALPARGQVRSRPHAAGGSSGRFCGADPGAVRDQALFRPWDTGERSGVGRELVEAGRRMGSGYTKTRARFLASVAMGRCGVSYLPPRRLVAGRGGQRSLERKLTPGTSNCELLDWRI